MLQKSTLLKIVVVTYLVLVFGLSWGLWAFLVHEPAHYLVCVWWGYDASIALSGSQLQPTTTCENIYGATYGFVFLKTIAPYLVDLMILAVFAFRIPRNRFLRLIPYTAFLDLLLNFILQVGDPKNDYTKILTEMPYAYWKAALIVAGAMIVFYVRYRKDSINLWVESEDFWRKKLTKK
ncbi:MAG: hypothetical protein JW778_04370 [Candidatus Altiarchaeota archaeon]|nr:hypothetical protein [Candidatus Altiarchaeota archaeon]